MTAIGVGRRAPRRDRADRWSAALRGAAVAVVLVGAVGSALLAQGWKSTVDHQRDERLDRTAASRTVTISGALANYESALQAARSLWLASNAVSRAEFNAFARSLDLRDRYPGLQAIGWRTVVTDNEADEFVARNRADGEPSFAIRPPGRRPVYYVTTLSYPRIPSSSSLGTDARAIPSILATLERARDTGETTMSNQTTLPGDIDLPADQRPVAFELFVPVYGGGEPGADATVAQRRRQFLGWATGQFRVSDFLDAAMTTAPPFTGVELHDEDVGGDSQVASYPRGFRAEGPYVREKQFTLGGRNFLLRYAPLPGNAVLTERTIPASLVLAIGVAASVLLGALLWLLAQVGALYREVGRLARTDSLTGVPTGGAGTRSCRASWPGRPAPARPCASPCSTWTTSRPTTTSTATGPGTGCSRRRRPPGKACCARPTCWPATAGRSSPSCCPTASSATPWRSPSGSGPPSPRAPARSGWPTGTGARTRTS
ncbi:MAG TPA: CHASE domain-containing protein [Actinomycetota bacterium]